MLKKQARFLSAITLALSSTAVFAVATVEMPNSPGVPELRPGFEVSIAALALKPSANNLNYVIYNNELPAQSPTWTEREIRPGFGAAFELGGRYVMTEGRDVKLTWTHLNKGANSTTKTPNANFFLGPDFEIGPDALTTRTAKGTARFMYDVINFDLGQLFNFNRHAQIRYFAGLSNADLRENVHATFSGNVVTGPFVGPFSTRQKVRSDFYGLGPRLGVNFNYHMDCGFGFIGEAAVSAIVGNLHTRTNYTSSAVELSTLFNQTINNQFIKDHKITQVIPAIDTKLGAEYRYVLKKDALITIEGGYQAAVYVNAVNQYLPGSVVVPYSTGGIFVATMSHTQSNYGVAGPYFKVAIEV